MNQEIKRRIDNARNVLVGKVPDPKSQVEQITTALIYKFMDDMDIQSVSIGGKPVFFIGDYQKYSWQKLMSPSLGGQARLSLYSEAIESFSKNPRIPQLFRDIFKDSYLPYRDPETLNLFLKEIDNFSYTTTDSIGDAYEYLLSVLGSQGKAGQFLTPRHIIRFIISVVDLKKNETILDPACGTAGFLISAYLHILQANTKNKLGDLLEPDDKKRISDNFVGYDIDPGMVRISLVNMYLHGFQQPHIYEYDTLTDDRKWQEQFDVIMANPPFMTPKGGIRPHKLFSIHANRSEVLFVDYIVEHLNLNGRAGVIVPEGIIFQSATAYKNLRKMLLDNSLWAVVSLPAGVFQPYSGVKTSILFMDKTLVKQTDKILFVKIENDGFDLGAQRREIDRNDLPLAREIMNFYKENINEDLPEQYKRLAHLVSKKKILDSGDYNLTGDRYKENHISVNQRWPMVKLEQVCKLIKEKSDVNIWPYMEIGDVDLYSKKYNFKDKRSVAGSLLANKNNVIVSKVRPNRGAIAIINEDKISVSGAFTILAPIQEKVYQKYLFLILGKDDRFLEYLGSRTKGTTYPTCSDLDVISYEIPLPPLEVQKQIADEVEGCQKVIDGARQVVENWKPTINIDPSWPMVKLDEVCKIFAGGDVPKESSKDKNEIYKFPIFTNSTNNKSLYGYSKEYRVNKNAVTISARGTIGYPELRTEPFYPAIRLIVCIPNENLSAAFLKYALSKFEFKKTGNTINQLTVPMVKFISVPLPPIEVQKKIVSKIEEEKQAVDACKKLIEVNEQKIKSKIAKVWGE